MRFCQVVLLGVAVLLCNRIGADKEKIEAIPYETPPIPSSAYFGDAFPSASGIGSRWVLTEATKAVEASDPTPYNGEWKIGLPQDVLLSNDYGLIMKSAARHHAISSKLDRIFKFESTPLVLQYDVKFQEMMECGGGYVKLISHSRDVDLSQFNDKTPFTIMFGPDKCGPNAKVHLIIRLENPVTGKFREHSAPQSDQNLVVFFQDKKTHLFTLVLNPDDKYYVYVDQREIMRGDLRKTLEPSIIPPKEIDDPTDTKPEEWDEREKIHDPNAVKPDDWDESQPEFVEDKDAVKPADWYDDEPDFVPDPAAKKPTDWDDELDGKWEPPVIPNPKCKTGSGCGVWIPPKKKNPLYKGKWSAPMIKNPNYQGQWKPRKVANPEYFELPNVFRELEPITAVGLELWTITPDVIFDNFLITNSKSDADAFAMHTWYAKQAAESSRDENVSFIRRIINAAEAKPWLWVVYVVVLLLPIGIILFWCFGTSKKSVGDSKKTDERCDDDDSEEETEEHRDPNSSSSRGVHSGDAEGSYSSDSENNDEVQGGSESYEKSKTSGKSSGSEKESSPHGVARRAIRRED
uniref:Calnexin n=1 Tax=Trichuris muris TaxID=70415 RepID=A0A5S6QIP0_TRIMR